MGLIILSGFDLNRKDVPLVLNYKIKFALFVLSQRKLLSYRENLKFSFKVFKIKRLFFWYSLKSLSKTLKKSLRCDSFWIIMHFVCIAKVNFHIVFLAWEYLRLVCSKRFLDQYSHMRAHKNFLYL